MSGFPATRLRARLAGEAGFSMIEVMVSMVLLTALSLATLSVIDRSTAASAKVRSKSVASDIAHEDLNRMRQLKFTLASSASYRSVSTETGVDKVPYTVTSTANWATDSGVETSCATPDTAGTSQYLRIRSSVSWPNMDGAAPVVADSIMAPRGKEANRTAGSLMVKVQDRGAAPVAGATVTAAGQSLVTSAAGCVFFPAINAGQWPVTVTKGGSPWNFMDTDGNSPGATTASVVVGDVSTASVTFDQPSIFSPVAFYREDGTTPTTWTSVSISTQTKTLPPATSASPVASFTTAKLFPFAAGWSFYAGSCAGNNPANYASNSSTALTNSSIIPTPGTTVPDGRAYLRRLTLHLTDSNIASGSEAVRAYITPYYDSTYTYMTATCESLPGTPPGGTITSVAPNATDVAFDMPYGLYSVCAETTATPGTSGYRYWKYSGSASAPPSGAYHALPSMSGITLKATSPANDAATVNGSLAGSGSANQCG
ncbi:hypothetical protein DSM104299_03506 [Baekduia alba]|uniref:prepilin-type N-terminal cleavage/methylation domain-containing protein n=1 Tax=Baekduia alba TaxID=2997333 RepID=UPI0023418E80|nr:prepilin-type N-terminal cleavage/methylation domain-containing protein [Baekduia alba]WCB94767.1 hypothetical protein DSM104299_03506 [Baekduia alba]